jgi:RimJ/RimL family protein N-acetyltransferase
VEKLAARMEGQVVVLEPIAESHRDALWDAAQPKEIWAWTSRIARDRRSFDALFNAALSASGSGERAVFATVDRNTEAVLGSTGFHSFYPRTSSSRSAPPG